MLLFTTFSTLFANVQADGSDLNDVERPDSIQKDEGEHSLEAAFNKIEEEDSTPKVANFNIEYDVLERSDNSSSTFFEVENGQTITLSYSFTNYEDADVDIVALGGNIVSLMTGESAANITRSELGPVNVPINETSPFQQKIKVDLNEGDYYMIPHVYVEKSGIQMRVGTNPTFIKVIPPNMSFFNPQFLSVQIFLLIVIGAITYYIFGLSFKSTTKPSKTLSKSSDWLPDIHKK